MLGRAVCRATGGVTNLIAIVVVNVLGRANEAATGGIALVIAVVRVDVTNLADKSAAYNITQGITNIGVNVLGSASEFAALYITIGIAIVVELVLGHASKAATLNVTIGVASVIELVLGFTGEAAVQITIGITGVIPFVRCFSYIRTRVTVDIASIGVIMGSFAGFTAFITVAVANIVVYVCGCADSTALVTGGITVIVVCMRIDYASESAVFNITQSIAIIVEDVIGNSTGCSATGSITLIVAVASPYVKDFALKVTTFYVTGSIAIVAPNVLGFTNITAGVAINVTIMGVLVFCCASKATTYGVTIGVTSVVPYVSNCTYKAAIVNVTGGITSVIENVTGNASFKFTTVDIAICVACAVKNVLGGACESATLGVTLVITTVSEYVRYFSYVVAEIAITSSVANVIVTVRFFGVGNPFPLSDEFDILEDYHRVKIPYCAVLKLPTNELVVKLGGGCGFGCQGFNLYLCGFNGASANRIKTYKVGSVYVGEVKNTQAKHNSKDDYRCNHEQAFSRHWVSGVVHILYLFC